ncbi:MAG: 2-amino-4-hydroxy-6-hydroxymethyldihydropteridine diphosphokinase [Verrucomicrobiae bacterium]
MRAGIALGSNLGDRLHFLHEARSQLLALHEGPGAFLCSKIYETAPMDCPAGSASFLNAAIELSTSLTPFDLLARLQQIETLLGRPQHHEFHEPRTMDLDLLYLDQIEISHAALTLPHPRISERTFVLDPLREICPERILPGKNLSVRWLRELLDLPKESLHGPIFHFT